MDKIEKALKDEGAENIEGYMLINNYGYTFDLKGNRYDARFWANCYGAALDYWEVMDMKNGYTNDAMMLTSLLNKVDGCTK